MKKSAQVVMLPTNEKAPTHDYLFLYKPSNRLVKNGFVQHLYFLSDEEIKEGDWFIMNSCIVRQCKSTNNEPHTIPTVVDTTGGIHHVSVCKKIIATTDRSLFTETKSIGYTEDRARVFYGKEYLPQPSQSFIEHFVFEYNKGNQITDVMVEYEYRHDDSVPYPKTLDGKAVLKINLDNTINIKPIKDSWSREEVTTLLYSLNRDKEGNFDCTKWIEENL